MSPPPVRGTLELGGKVDELPKEFLSVSKARELLVTRSLPVAYESDGSIAQDTLRALGEGGRTFGGSPERLPDGDVVHVYEEDVIWGGTLTPHYGHFLTESIARLWPLLPGHSLAGLPVVFTRPNAAPFVRDWIDGFGGSTVELPEQGVVRFRRMFVAEPAWRHDAWIAPEIRDIHLSARRGLEVPPSRGHDVLWLSRSALDPDRIPYDEGLLEWILADHVTIVHPETMTLAEQIAMLEGSRAVAGVVGSAFHTLLLAEALPACLYLCPPWDQAAFPAQHRFLDTEATFVQALGVAARTRRARERGLFFPGGYRMSIPSALHALDATVLPDLLEDPRLAAFASAEAQPEGGSRAPAADTDAAIARVLLDPRSMRARAALAAVFEAEGLEHLAREQLSAVADLTDDA
ncbi:MAG TPA: glycosyltransferase 61 family protein [Solirubrobacterales bacterium]|nr:glycosyltransferase 61 family protein [Solirubrobacterales bacterium]